MSLNIQNNVAMPQNNINFRANSKDLAYRTLDFMAFEMPLNAATGAKMSVKQNKNNNYFKSLFSYLRQFFCKKTDINAEVLDKACFKMPMEARKNSIYKIV